MFFEVHTYIMKFSSFCLTLNRNFFELQLYEICTIHIFEVIAKWVDNNIKWTLKS